MILVSTLPRSFQRILVVRRDNVGDLLCTTPLLRALRQRYPAAQIAVLCNSYNAAVLANNPDITTLYQYTKAKHGQSNRLYAWLKEWDLYRVIRRIGFDVAIHANPHPHPRTARLLKWLDIPHRVGVDDAANSRFTVPIHPRDVHGVHEVERVFSLARPLGISGEPGPLVFVPPLAAWGATRLKPGTRPLIGIHISSRKACNRWPLPHVVRLIESLTHERFGVALFWAYGEANDPRYPGDNAAARELTDRFGDALTIYPMETLKDLIVGLAQTDCVVTPDGGAMHIAAALNKPVVALFCCTDPNYWRPWCNAHRVIKCTQTMEDVQPDAVLAQIHALLAAPWTPAPAPVSVMANVPHAPKR